MKFIFEKYIEKYNNKMPKCSVRVNYKYLNVLVCDTCDRHFNSDKLFELHKRITHNESYTRVMDEIAICGNCGFRASCMSVVDEHQKRCSKLLTTLMNSNYS